MKIIFFCGDQSRYGIGHLIPLLESRFQISKVIIATPERWKIFRQALQGKKYYKGKEFFNWSIKSLAKAILPAKVINLLRSLRIERISSERTNIDIKSICNQRNVSLIEVFDVNDTKFCDELKKEEYNLFISAAYPQIFSANLLKIPEKAAVNFHPSALPRCRGAHPHYWALAKGEQYGGVTAHFMTEKIDNGDIIAQTKFSISRYNYADHYGRIEKEIPQLVKKVENYFFGTGKESIPQNSEEKTYFRNDREIHHRIFWNLHDAEQIYNIYRAGNAFFFLMGEKFILTKAYISGKNRNMTNQVAAENGAVVDFCQDAVVIKVLKGFINIQAVQFRGRNLSWRKWADKSKIRIGLKME
jgi:methionyl-tRNA formyltransferase